MHPLMMMMKGTVQAPWMPHTPNVVIAEFSVLGYFEAKTVGAF